MEEATLRNELSAAFDDVTKVEEKEKLEVKDEKLEEKPEVKEEKPETPEKVEGAEKKEEKPEVKEEKPEVKEEKVEKQEKPEQINARAPGSWKPTARELWGKVPPQVQQEILRREKEINRGFSEVTQAKQFTENFNRTIQPHANMIAAEGGDPVKFVNNLLHTASALYYGAPMQKAQVVAGFIKTFGVDIQTLDSLLAGTMPANGGQPATDQRTLIQAEVTKAISPLVQAFQTQRQEEDKSYQDLIEEFANDPQNEFFEDVKDTMADILEVAAKRGQKMTLQDAYARATMLDKGISEIISSRTLQKKADEASAAAAAARKKAVSVTGAPAKDLSSSSGSGSLRDDILNSLDSLS